jgi:hypothetical protein
MFIGTIPSFTVLRQAFVRRYAHREGMSITPFY